MIYNLLEINAEEALNGTTSVNTLALMGGATILRVHDAKQAMQAIKIYHAFYNREK
jgi:dihydropteroate synthase